MKKLNPADVLSESLREGVRMGMDIATDLNNIDERRNLLAAASSAAGQADGSEKSDIRFGYTLGLYPSEAEQKHFRNDIDRLESELRRRIEDPLLWALGEIGLDFYWNYSTPDRQKELFQSQVELAQTFDLPIVIHNREADRELYEILQNPAAPPAAPAVQSANLAAPAAPAAPAPPSAPAAQAANPAPPAAPAANPAAPAPPAAPPAAALAAPAAPAANPENPAAPAPPAAQGTSRVRGIMHCFSSNREWMEAFLDLGFFISFAGNVTFKNAGIIQDAARAVPLDRVLLETDSPHLAPVPKRGTINRPAFVSHVYRFFAELRGMTPHEVQEQVSENFIRAVPRSAGGEGPPVPEQSAAQTPTDAGQTPARPFPEQSAET